MSTRIIVAIVAMCIATTGFIWSNLLLMTMIGEINRKRADEDLVSYSGFSLPKMQRVFAEYRRAYPTGRLHTYAAVVVAVACAAILIAAVPPCING